MKVYYKVDITRIIVDEREGWVDTEKVCTRYFYEKEIPKVTLEDLIETGESRE